MMRIISRVFFVFNEKDVIRLVANPHFVSDLDQVISAVPGVDLQPLLGLVECLTLENALSKFGITQHYISQAESAFCIALLDADAIKEALSILSPEADESVRLALLNHVGLLTHNHFAFETVFKALADSGLKEVYAFQSYGQYRMVERPDIRMLLKVELGLLPHLIHLCSASEIKLHQVGSYDRLAQVKNMCRDFLLFSYKWITLLARSFRRSRSVKFGPCDLAVVARARTEVVAAAPILSRRIKFEKNDLMLIDDLIKSPDGSAAAEATGRPWVALHSFSSVIEVFRIFFRCMVLRRKAARIGVEISPDRVKSFGFLGRPEIALEILYTAFSSVAELLVHRLQLVRALEYMKPKAIISFDTVDRWGAMQGELARKMRTPSIMIQNTAVDDINYPWPLSMDNLVVGNERVRRIFVRSGANPDRVHATGLPLHDEHLKTGKQRFVSLRSRASNDQSKLRLLIATQPFVQEYDYNGAMIEDLEVVTQDLSYSVEWILKPHPRENILHYKKLQKKLNNNNRIVHLFDGPFEQAISEVDVVVSRTSTSLETAALGGVPSIAHLSSYPADIVDRLDYLKSPVTIKTFDREQLFHALARFEPNSRLLTLHEYEQHRLSFLKSFYPSDGKATESVIKLVDKGVTLC